MNRIDASTLDLKERVVSINRVAKTVKGGRNMRFSTVVVVGDANGIVGAGMGDAKKHLIKVPIVNTTIPHEVQGEFGAGSVLMMPAKEGSGVIAGGPVRAVMELAGIQDIRTKSLGSSNPRNVINATMSGLARLKTAEDVAGLRGKSTEEILG